MCLCLKWKCRHCSVSATSLLAVAKIARSVQIYADETAHLLIIHLVWSFNRRHRRRHRRRRRLHYHSLTAFLIKDEN